MKKRILNVLAMSAAVLAAGVGLASCGNNVTTSTNTKKIEPTTTVVETTTANPTETTTSTPETTTTKIYYDPNKNYDDVTSKLKLKKTYDENSDFFVDGIEEVKLTKSTDGDTANFRCKNTGRTLTVRFFSINTPESTGAVEKWGKAASHFTENKLVNAYSILLEGSETPPVTDSNGTRYLAYVWYKETEESDWKNLCLELVENGYTKNNCDASLSNYSIFEEAQTFAKKAELHIWGDATDPYYSEDAIATSIPELKQNFGNFYDDEEDFGQKVAFEGYITGLTISSSKTYTFHVTDFDENGQTYTINVYAGYSNSKAAMGLKVGSKYSFVGTVQKYYGEYQVSGITYMNSSLITGKDYTKVLVTDYYYNFNSDVEYKSYMQVATLYKNAFITKAQVEGSTLVLTAKAVNTYAESTGDSTETEFVFECACPTGLNVSSLVGKMFSVAGIKPVADSNVITVLKYSDFIFK